MARGTDLGCGIEVMFSQAAKILVLIVVGLEVIAFLVPTTLFYASGMLFLILGFFGANDKPTLAYLALAFPLLIPGYGLFALWWLVFKFRSITMGEIPGHIWTGLAVGIASALLFAVPFMNGGMSYVTQWENIQRVLLFGGGPLTVVISLLFLIWLQNKPQREDQSKIGI